MNSTLELKKNEPKKFFILFFPLKIVFDKSIKIFPKIALEMKRLYLRKMVQNGFKSHHC